MRHERYRSKLLASSLSTMSYTNKDTLSPIFDALTRKKPTTYYKRYTKESAVTTWE